MVVADIIENAKVEAEDADPDFDGAISDSQWTRLVNNGIKSLHKRLVRVDPAQFMETRDFSLVGGTIANSSFDLYNAANFPALPLPFSVIGLDKNPTLTTRETIRPRHFQERNSFSLFVGFWTPAAFNPDTFYDLRGKNLVINPFELSNGNYRLYYIGLPYQFTSENDATALDLRFERYIEYVEKHAARAALRIEQSDISDITSELGDLILEIESAHDRDNSSGGTIADTEDI